MKRISAPGPLISPGIKVSRTRRMPVVGEVIVEMGERLSPSDVVARAGLPGVVQHMAAASTLGVPRGKLESYLSVRERDRVEEGQILGTSKAFFVLFGPALRSPVAVTIEPISTVRQHLTPR